MDGRVSVIIPSRNERFLIPTVKDVLSKAVGDVEIIVVLEGYWVADLPADPRIKILHHGKAMGMRPSINAAVEMSTGQFLMKLDAHCMVGEGFDEILREDYHEDNWLVVPRRYALEPESWTIDTSNKKYPIDYHYLSYPYERLNDVTCGLHGTNWNERRKNRDHILLDDEMSSQGSCWFMSRDHWNRLGDMDSTMYGNFIHEMQELGLKTWLGGGAMKVNKRTWYAHLFKGRKYGRGYILGQHEHKDAVQAVSVYWMNNQWEDRVHDLRWLIEKFSPVPTWPADLDTVFRG